MIPVRSGRSHDKQMGTNAGAAEVVLPCHVAQATGKMSSLATAISKGTNIVSLGVYAIRPGSIISHPPTQLGQQEKFYWSNLTTGLASAEHDFFT